MLQQHRLHPGRLGVTGLPGRHVRGPAGCSLGGQRDGPPGLLVDRRPLARLERPAPGRRRVLLGERHDHRAVRGRGAAARRWSVVHRPGRGEGLREHRVRPGERRAAARSDVVWLEMLAGDRVVHLDAVFAAGPEGTNRVHDECDSGGSCSTTTIARAQPHLGLPGNSPLAREEWPPSCGRSVTKSN